MSLEIVIITALGIYIFIILTLLNNRSQMIIIKQKL